VVDYGMYFFGGFCSHEVQHYFFSVRVSFGVMDSEFAEQGDRFFGCVVLTDEIEVLPDDQALLSDCRFGWGFSTNKVVDLVENPWIADTSTCDDNTVNFALVEAIDNIVGCEQVATAYESHIWVFLFDLVEYVPVCLSTILFTDGSAVDYQCVDVVMGRLVAYLPETVH